MKVVLNPNLILEYTTITKITTQAQLNEWQRTLKKLVLEVEQSFTALQSHWAKLSEDATVSMQPPSSSLGDVARMLQDMDHKVAVTKIKEATACGKHS